MARFRHLPVWQTALDLAVHLEKVVRGFPRYYKDALGTELRQTAQRVCRLVTRANEVRDEAGAAAAATDRVRRISGEATVPSGAPAEGLFTLGGSGGSRARWRGVGGSGCYRARQRSHDMCRRRNPFPRSPGLRLKRAGQAHTLAAQKPLSFIQSPR